MIVFNSFKQARELSLIHKVGCPVDISDFLYLPCGMPLKSKPQQERALQLLRRMQLMRATDFAQRGITRATLSRMKERGLVTQPRRGLYQLPDAPIDTNHAMAELSKLVPQCTICLISALAFHELTVTLPGRVWIAIGQKARRPKITYPAIHVVRFAPTFLRQGTERRVIDGVSVRLTNPARTVVDLFHYRKTTGLNLAIEGLREALRQRKATPAQIARYARQRSNLWKTIQPYLETLTADA